MIARKDDGHNYIVCFKNREEARAVVELLRKMLLDQKVTEIRKNVQRQLMNG